MSYGIMRVDLTILAEMLHLPKDYKVVSITEDKAYRCAQLLVVADDIPETKEGYQLPVVSPKYVQQDGRVEIVSIDIHPFDQ